ncbi:MAG: Stage II sporulation protein P (SpoIIP) [Firmicutes bacterium ADurb.Bin193]|nr:MAG: Stage II sporulation protein P (SpoIIP) [Firmicutes bacterium ADurb.Bin193]
MRGASRYRVRVINIKKIKMATVAAFTAAGVILLGQGLSGGVPLDVNSQWLKAIFCESVPVARPYINPIIKTDISVLEILFGFNIKEPFTIISSQIAVVSASGGKDYGEATDKKTPPPKPTPIPAKAKPIEEITIDPQEQSGYQSSNKVFVKNETSYDIDIEKTLNEKLSFSIKKGSPQVLIVHTHTSEAFAPTDKNYYVPTDPDRTEDNNYNITRVGAEMAKTLNEMGIQTLHDTTGHDYPSYNGSYKNCLATVQSYLKKYPSIKIVLDIHRDGMTTADGKKLKVCTTLDGKKTAQVMILCGTDANGLDHHLWRENFKLALKIQAKMTDMYPSLARPLMLVKERYNMNTTTGSLLIEVGSNGNTLEEAINGGHYAAKAIGKLLGELQ